MLKFLKRVLGGARKRSSDEPPPIAPDQRLDEALRLTRARLERFLLTRAQPGKHPVVIEQNDDWRLSRVNPGLFRLEAPNLSILINTEPFLSRKDGKVGGLLRMSELQLNRALQAKGGLEAFLDRADPLPEHSRDLASELRGSSDETRGQPRTETERKARLARALGAEPAAVERAPQAEVPGASAGDFDARPGIQDLKTWRQFDLDQMITRNTPNTLALVLVRADAELERLLRSRLSERLKALVASELDSLASAGSNPELNPHSRTRSLVDFEAAIREFEDRMADYHRREYVKNLRESGRAKS